MVLFVVVDTMGGGRTVGVFDSESAAQRVIGEFPEYYRVDRCTLNQIDPTAVEWARNEAQKEHLRRLIGG